MPLSDDAQAIWRAGVEAVTPRNLICDHIRLTQSGLSVRGVEIDLSQAKRLVVVGGGKAAGDMATEFEAQLIPSLRKERPDLAISGCVTCPELSEQQRETRHEKLQHHANSCIEVIEARPMGINTPTAKAIQGTRQILSCVKHLEKQDVALCLLSGGGSALLTAPTEGISLQEKQQVASVLAAHGATIEQLNAVRRAISDVKGGGLARACAAGVLVTAILSDVLGDSLETIASGPTVLEANNSPHRALEVLTELDLLQHPQLSGVLGLLKGRINNSEPASLGEPSTAPRSDHVILGNNADSVEAAKNKAEQLGYYCPNELISSACSSEPDVNEVAASLTKQMHALLQNGKSPACLLSGGEPTVRLPANAGRGGRNQQLALLLLRTFLEAEQSITSGQDLAFLSAGTDGEDGPTDAAGGFFDSRILAAAHESMSIATISEHLDRADAYPVLEQLGGLLRTGVTGTNVCDLRVGLLGHAR